MTILSRILPAWRRSATILACVICAVSGHAQPANQADTRQALESIVSQINDLDSWFSDTAAQRVRWLKEVRQQDHEVAALSASAQAANAELQEVRENMADLEVEHATLDILRREQAQKISQHLAAAHRLGGQDFVKVLFSRQTPETFDRIMRYHGYFSNARVASLRAYQKTLADLEANRLALADHAARQQQNHTTLIAGQKALLSKRSQRKVLLAALDTQREGKSVQRERLLDDRARLKTLLAELNRRTGKLDGSVFLAGKGSLPWPVKGPIRSTFGTPRADGRLVWHGMVVSVKEGTPITAVFRGRVIFADWLRGFGLLTIVDHGSGYMTLYGHADSLTKVVGDWVESGELIARAGRSGGQVSSGMYFEIRQKGTARDPLSWLAKRET